MWKDEYQKVRNYRRRHRGHAYYHDLGWWPKPFRWRRKYEEYCKEEMGDYYKKKYSRTLKW